MFVVKYAIVLLLTAKVTGEETCEESAICVPISKCTRIKEFQQCSIGFEYGICCVETLDSSGTKNEGEESLTIDQDTPRTSELSKDSKKIDEEFTTEVLSLFGSEISKIEELRKSGRREHFRRHWDKIVDTSPKAKFFVMNFEPGRSQDEESKENPRLMNRENEVENYTENFSNSGSMDLETDNNYNDSQGLENEVLSPYYNETENSMEEDLSPENSTEVLDNELLEEKLLKNGNQSEFQSRYFRQSSAMEYAKNTSEVAKENNDSSSSRRTNRSGKMLNFAIIDNDCGRNIFSHKRSKRIVGGRASASGQHPWQVLVVSTEFFGLYVKRKCGGVLISSRHILTAAHCRPRRYENLKVILGTNNLNDFKAIYSKAILVRKIYVHKDFEATQFSNDIAILEIAEESNVMPICLPGARMDYVGRTAIVSGWGNLSHRGNAPDLLHYTEVPIIDQKLCKQWFEEKEEIKDIKPYYTCAGFQHGGQDSCGGDSGSPLSVQEEDGRWTVVAIVSHGIKCAEPKMPGIYTNISYFMDWITDTIRN